MQVLVIGRSDGPDVCSITCRKCDEVFHVKTNSADTKKVGAKRMLELLRIVVPVIQSDSESKPSRKVKAAAKNVSNHFHKDSTMTRIRVTTIAQRMPDNNDDTGAAILGFIILVIILAACAG